MSPPGGEITSEYSDEGVEDWGSEKGAAPPPPPLPPINIINYDSYRIHSSWRSNHEIVEEDDDDDEDEDEDEDEDDDDDEDGQFRRRSLLEPIIEESEEGKSSNGVKRTSDVLYVVAWRGNEELASVSMDALAWTVNNAIRDSSIVYLVHVFPELRYIPTPLGNLPISQVNEEQKESYMLQERSKRSAYLQKFLHLCPSSKVTIETVLIESDKEAKAILDLIPILNIRNLVLGTTKSSLRKIKSSSKKGGGNATVEQILHNAPEFCDVKIIYQGKQVPVQDLFCTDSPTPSSVAPTPRTVDAPMQLHQDPTDGFVNCSCFKL